MENAEEAKSVGRRLLLIHTGWMIVGGALITVGVIWEGVVLFLGVALVVYNGVMLGLDLSTYIKIKKLDKTDAKPK